MDEKVRYFLDETLAELPKRVTLIYIDYRDQLSDEQIAALLEDRYEDLWESLSEFEMNSLDYAIPELLREYAPDAEAADAIRDDDEAWEEWREECQERDDSTWFDDLVRNTPGIMVRYSLGYDVPEGAGCLDEDAETEARAMADAAGISYDVNRDALHSLLANASYGGTLCVLHRSDVADVVKVRDGGTVTFTDPLLLVYDGWNGSGHMEDIEGTVVVKVDEDTMRHDSGRVSWSDGIAGIVHSSCETPAVFESTKVTR